ncbi:MAG TPA: 50S ribosomal protein L3, partial [Candidatus Altiarchaeales archaeon]|nr:50S ribosomal protein L3 [Candidatus Altiarchaeales archaeon]
LGKEINVEDVFSENKFVDVVAVTKGKGFQGPVKRFGIRIQPRKAGKGRRHIGTGGAWKPARKLWREPLPGQMGYHTRTELNKLIIKIGKNGKEITPQGDFLRYGDVRNSYILVKGSVPGPAKRLIRFSNPRRQRNDVSFEIDSISLSSKQGV